MDIKLPFGLKNNKIVHIDDIPDEGGGKRCGCVCPNPECRSPLIAVYNAREKLDQNLPKIKWKNAV
jgi:hypothetical protein